MGVLFGAIAGGSDEKSYVTTTPNVKEAWDTAAYRDSTYKSFGQSSALADAGPGAGDVSAATGATRSLADMFQQYSQTGGLPTAADISTGQGLSAGLFGAQRTALQQSFNDQTTMANRQAATMGRDPNDPVLQAKLRTSLFTQQNVLSAQQNDTGNQIAMGLPGQRLGYAQQRAGIMSGLASQAFSNRAAILSQGGTLLQGARNYDLASGGVTQEKLQPGSIGGAATGAMGGMQADAAMIGSVGKMMAAA